MNDNYVRSLEFKSITYIPFCLFCQHCIMVWISCSCLPWKYVCERSGWPEDQSSRPVGRGPLSWWIPPWECDTWKKTKVSNSNFYYTYYNTSGGKLNEFGIIKFLVLCNYKTIPRHALNLMWLQQCILPCWMIHDGHLIQMISHFWPFRE